MKNVFEWFLFILIVLGGIGFILAWFYGVPYGLHLIYDKIAYSVYLSAWLTIHLIRNITGRVKAENKLKQYSSIHKILGGK